jgi:hypothetical protein
MTSLRGAEKAANARLKPPRGNSLIAEGTGHDESHAIDVSRQMSCEIAGCSSRYCSLHK